MENGMQNNNAASESTYNADVQRIQDIIEELKKNCDVDNMLALVQEASALIKKCQDKLMRTGLEIDDALSKLDNDSAK